jgi:hypothetical protein
MIGIDSAIAEGLKIINKFIPDGEAKAKAEAEFRSALLESETKIATSQIEVNKEEAKNANLFVSGWRPFIGWVCGVAFAYHFVILPILMFIAALSGATFDSPEFDMDSLFAVLGGMLGLGGLRTFEKFKGVAK